MSTLKKITLYVTSHEFQFLKSEAHSHGVSLAYFLRALIDQYSPIDLPPLAKQGAPPGNSNRHRPKPDLPSPQP